MAIAEQDRVSAGAGLPARDEGRGSRVALALIVFGLLCGASLLLWKFQRGKDQRDAEYARVKGAHEIGGRLANLINRQMEPAEELVRRFRSGKIIEQQQFQAATASEKMPAAFLTVAWIDRDGWCRYAWHRGEETELLSGFELGSSEAWGHQIDEAAARREPRVVYLREERGRSMLTVVFPAIAGEGTSAAYLGSVAVRVDMGLLLTPLIDESRDFDITVFGGGISLAVVGNPIPNFGSDASNEAVPLYNRVLRVRARASPAYLARSVPSVAPWVLGIGLTLSTAVAFAVWFALKRRSQAAWEARRRLAAIESLTTAAGAISSRPGAGMEVLERLAASTRRLLGVRLVAIGIVDEAADTLRVMGQDGLTLRPVGEVYHLKDLPRTRACMQSRQVLAVSDAMHDDAVNAKAMLGLGSRSGLFVPLIVEDHPIGLLFAGDTQPRQFSASEIHLAAAVGSQAAVIMSNARLYQQAQEALESQRKLSSKHEALYTLSTELYRAGGLDRSLQNLADAAPALLGVDRCVVSLREGRGDGMIIAAVTGTDQSAKGERYHTLGTNDHVVMNSGEPLEVEQADADPSIHPMFRHRMNIGSLIYQPLLGSFGKRIGLMTLIRQIPGAFTAEQRELSQVLATRAAAAIETIRLHEMSRRAAETQEMLLRELNHRVKNNLASIVALLSMDRPRMSEDAQDWLDRVTGRIATMARTHELFVGGNDTVSLKDLVAKLLPSLSMVMPTGVEVKTELEGARVKLGTERAVSLAMVLNELCWNALEHGMGENGVLRISGRSKQGQLGLEVADDGRGKGGGAGNGRGTGLRLVEGLVTRELRGRFDMVRSEAGTVAKLEIPLEPGEDEELC